MAARLLNSTDILSAVGGSEVLKELVTRPLFARMLTYVGMGDSARVDSATGLYEDILDNWDPVVGLVFEKQN